jgi:hypothetical protein
MKCQPATIVPQAAVPPLRIVRSCRSSASDAEGSHPRSAFSRHSLQNSGLRCRRPDPRPGVVVQGDQSRPVPPGWPGLRVKPGKTKNSTIAMRVPLPIPNQPQPTPFPSAVRCEIFVVPIPNNNLSPVRGGISPPRARPFRPAGAWDFIGHGAQAGQAPVKPGKTMPVRPGWSGSRPVKPGKTNFTGSYSNHARSKPLQINARPHRQAEFRLKPSQINNDVTPCAKINCYPMVDIVVPKGCYPVALVG